MKKFLRRNSSILFSRLLNIIVIFNYFIIFKKCSWDLFLLTALRLAPDASNFGDSKMKITFFHCGVKVTIRKVEYPNPWCCYWYVWKLVLEFIAIEYLNIFNNSFGCWALCCAGCQDVEHRCSKCDAIQGTYRPY